MASVIGLTLVKLNGIFELNVKNARWDDGRPVVQHDTGGGVEIATGLEHPSGSFDAVIPRTGARDWRALKDFTIDVYDMETRSVVVASFSGCEWERISGSGDLASANASKSVSWKGRKVNQV